MIRQTLTPNRAVSAVFATAVLWLVSTTATAQPPYVPPPAAEPPPWVDPASPVVPPRGALPFEPVAPGLLPAPGGAAPIGPYGFDAFEQPLPLVDYDWLYIDAPQPREIAVNDIITIIVKEQARMSVDSRYNRNRTGSLKAELKEFLRLDDDGNLANAADNQPSIDGSITSRVQSTGQVAEREDITYRIAATVMDVKPNGTLELSARKTIASRDGLLEYELSGTLRAEDVNRDNTALSENIANLHVVRKQDGKVYHATKRPWGMKLYDLLFPF